MSKCNDVCNNGNKGCGCQYDSKFISENCVVDTKIVYGPSNLSSCSEYIKKYLNKQGFVPKGCFKDDPRSCFCEDKYNLNININDPQFDYKSCYNLSYADKADGEINYKGGCIGNNPTSGTLKDSIDCCTGKTSQADKNTKCGIGKCPGGKQCADVMTEYCSQSKLTSSQFQECLDYVNSATKPSSEWGNYEGASNVVQRMLYNLYPNYKNYRDKLYKNPSNKLAIKLCNTGPAGACDEVLNKLCSRFNDVSELKCKSGDKYCQEVSELCGCHLKKELYFQDGNNKDVPIQCNPACIVPGVIKFGSKDKNGNPVRVGCSKNLCIINYETESAWSSSDLNINQECGGNSKSSDPYDCYIDINILADGNNILNNNINQECSKCFEYDSNDPYGKIASVDCKKGPSSWNHLSTYGWLILGLILFLSVIVIILIFLEKN